MRLSASTRGRELSAELKRFLAVAKVAFIASSAVAGINLVVCLFAVFSLWAPKCAGRVWDEDSGAVGIMALAFVVIFLTGMIGLMAKRYPLLEREFEKHNFGAAYGFLPMVQLTFAEVVFYNTLFVALVMLAIILGTSVSVCWAVLADCLGW
jgi:heme/copper-type cytochrome/quinol oxidase subunit 1